MSGADQAIPTPDWSKASGDIWARRWRDTDAALAGISAELLRAIRACARTGPLKAVEVGCGPGTTTMEVAEALPEAQIVACDISPSLAAIAEQRLESRGNVRVVVGDAQALVPREAPLDLIFSRHGVMFFDDPAVAFTSLRSAARDGAGLVFSCFRAWELNPWAAEVASAAAGRTLPAPGREPGGFAFADPACVKAMLISAGWQAAEPVPVDFAYIAGEGAEPVATAFSFLSELGPAARVIEKLSEAERPAALERMRRSIEAHHEGGRVAFDAAAWIWSAEAA